MATDQGQPQTAKPDRNALRAKIFSAKKFESEIIELYGAQVEVRQPKLGDILKARETEDRAEALTDLAITYCYVPGTEEKIFEEGDKDALMELPFGSDFARLNQVIVKLTDIDVLGEEKN